jgi:hypothetical protein
VTTTKSFFAYDDDYPTCASTHATLCIYLSDDDDPTILSEKLGLQPSRTQVKGELRQGKVKRWPTASFLETSEEIRSKDVRRHIDWLLEQIQGKSEIIQQLQVADSEVHISCYWASAVGHGGPMLDQDILKRIAEFNIGISFDIYFAGDKVNETFDDHFGSKNRNRS